MSISFRNHQIFKQAILIRDFDGIVKVDEIIASWDYLLDNKLIHRSTKGVINNLTDCSLDMDIRSFEKLMVYLRSKSELANLKLAVICESPKAIVFPMMGQELEEGLKIKPFSTIEAAVDWII